MDGTATEGEREGEEGKVYSNLQCNANTRLCNDSVPALCFHPVGYLARGRVLQAVSACRCIVSILE